MRRPPGARLRAVGRGRHLAMTAEKTAIVLLGLACRLRRLLGTGTFWLARLAK